MIYLDPPFNSNRDYAAPIGSEAAGAAFKDTWTLNDVDEAWHGEIADRDPALYGIIDAAGPAHGKSMKSYLIMMAVRLLEMRRILRETGSLYLHCDPTASHYLKTLMDAIFSKQNFRNDITWKRRYGTFSQVHTANKFGICNDNILFYAKSDNSVFNTQYSFDDPGYQAYLKRMFRHKDQSGRLYRIDNLANPAPRPNLMYDYKGYPCPKNGWAISKEKMEQWDQEGRLHFPTKKTGRIQRKRFLDEVKGRPVQSIWSDIDLIASQSNERTGYPTQKPLGLLERIIQASSNEGDMILDPFCGCATACVAAEKHGRRWIGIDISSKAYDLVSTRMRKELGLFGKVHHRTDIPQRTDQGTVPSYKTHKHTLFGKQEGVCNGCRHAFQFRNFTIDHVVPQAKGGTDHLDNLQLLCGACNSMKGSGTQEALIAKLKQEGIR